ncbi:hypothetical protein IIA16_00400 [bacterium]|nr:hypothetical protein [bacterium]
MALGYAGVALAVLAYSFVHHKFIHLSGPTGRAKSTPLALVAVCLGLLLGARAPAPRPWLTPAEEGLLADFRARAPDDPRALAFIVGEMALVPDSFGDLLRFDVAFSLELEGETETASAILRSFSGDWRRRQRLIAGSQLLLLAGRTEAAARLAVAHSATGGQVHPGPLDESLTALAFSGRWKEAAAAAAAVVDPLYRAVAFGVLAEAYGKRRELAPAAEAARESLEAFRAAEGLPQDTLMAGLYVVRGLRWAGLAKEARILATDLDDMAAGLSGWGWMPIADRETYWSMSTALLPLVVKIWVAAGDSQRAGRVASSVQCEPGLWRGLCRLRAHFNPSRVTLLLRWLATQEEVRNGASPPASGKKVSEWEKPWQAGALAEAAAFLLETGDIAGAESMAGPWIWSWSFEGQIPIGGRVFFLLGAGLRGDTQLLQSGFSLALANNPSQLRALGSTLAEHPGGPATAMVAEYARGIALAAEGGTPGLSGELAAIQQRLEDGGGPLAAPALAMASALVGDVDSGSYLEAAELALRADPPWEEYPLGLAQLAVGWSVVGQEERAEDLMEEAYKEAHDGGRRYLPQFLAGILQLPQGRFPSSRGISAQGERILAIWGECGTWSVGPSGLPTSRPCLGEVVFAPRSVHLRPHHGELLAGIGSELWRWPLETISSRETISFPGLAGSLSSTLEASQDESIAVIHGRKRGPFGLVDWEEGVSVVVDPGNLDPQVLAVGPMGQRLAVNVNGTHTALLDVAALLADPEDIEASIREIWEVDGKLCFFLEGGALSVVEVVGSEYRFWKLGPSSSEMAEQATWGKEAEGEEDSAYSKNMFEILFPELGRRVLLDGTVLTVWEAEELLAQVVFQPPGSPSHGEDLRLQGFSSDLEGGWLWVMVAEEAPALVDVVGARIYRLEEMLRDSYRAQVSFDSRWLVINNSKEIRVWDLAGARTPE